MLQHCLTRNARSVTTMAKNVRCCVLVLRTVFVLDWRLSLSSKVTRLEVRKDAQVLARFEAKANEWRCDSWTLEGADLQYIQHMAAGLRASAEIDLCWFFDHAGNILGSDAPLALICNRYKDNFFELSQILAFICWQDLLLKHKTLRKC